MQNLEIAYLMLLRPKQWTKNLLVFAALLFVGGFHNPYQTLLTVAAFVAMCFVSSATYIFNDIRDVERDRRHPLKRTRPIASGRVSGKVAGLIAVACLSAGLAIAAWVGVGAIALVLVYLALQLAYNAFLKQIAVADVFTIALGFVLRAVLGAVAIDVKISGWLLFCTGALALLLGFSKRRNEFLTVPEPNSTRESLAHYTRTSLDALVAIFAGASAMCYGIYCLESETARKYPGLIITSVFVFYGIARYVLIVFSKDEGAEPESLLYRDRHLLLSVALFVVSAILAINGLEVPFISS